MPTQSYGHNYKGGGHIKNRAFHIFCLTSAGAVFGFALAFFLSPHGIVMGGLSGVAIILERFLPIRTGTLFFLLNTPFLTVGFLRFGKKFMLSTLYSTLVSSLFADLFSFALASYHLDGLLANALLGGIFSGVGLGVIFGLGSTTGGTDIVVRLIKQYAPRSRVGLVFFSCDFLVVALSAVTLKNWGNALYSSIALLVSCFFIDLVASVICKNGHHLP